MSRTSLTLLILALLSAVFFCGISASSIENLSTEQIEALVDEIYDEILREQDANNDMANCNCSWASKYTCGTNDGTVCNIQCCKRFRTSSSGGNKPSGGGSTSSSGGWKNGKTTRYFDCSKPSCSWRANTNLPTFVKACLADGVNKAKPDAPNGNRQGGGDGSAYAYTCTNQQPFTKDGVMYAFAAANVQCCTCYEMEFLSHSVGGASSYRGQLAGKKMIVQVTNKGGDLSGDHFDLMIPGGGFGLFDGCTHQWGRNYKWGARYGGVSSEAECSGLPKALQAGCKWRFRDFMNADNPGVKFRKLSKCPSVLTNISGCMA